MENSRLKKLVADPALDIQILKEAFRPNLKALNVGVVSSNSVCCPIAINTSGSLNEKIMVP